MPGKRKIKKKTIEPARLIAWAVTARRVSVGALAVACCLAIGWGATLSRDALRQRLPTPAIALPDRPEWIRTTAWQEIAPKVAPGESFEPRAYGRRWANSAWVRDVRIVRQGSSARAEISFRKPVQSIDWGSGLCTYTDREGVALALDQMTREAGAACLTVQGVAPERTRPELGKPLSSEAVKLTGALADQLSPLRGPLELDRLVVGSSQRGGAGDAEIVSMSGGRIIWGKLEKNGNEKVQALRRRSAPLRTNEVMDLRHLDG